MYYEQRPPETKRLRKPRLPLNRKSLLRPVPFALHQAGKDATRLPGHLLRPYALRRLH